MKKVLAIGIVFVLSACSPVGKAAVEGGIERVRSTNDTTADVSFAGLCALPYGAVLRRPANERLGAKLICDPSALDNVVKDIVE